MKNAITVTLIAILTALPDAAQAQESSAMIAAGAAFNECLALVESDADKRSSTAAFERAEKAFRAAVAAEPRNADAHAGLGQTLSRCGVPHASMTSVMGIVDQSTRALQSALLLDPQHWLARYVLAMNHFNMPGFLGRTPDAIRELETLRTQQGTRNDAPHFALTYLRLGDLYLRAGRKADAAAAYGAGAALFPDDAELAQRVREHGGSDAVDAADETQGESFRDLIALQGLTVDASQYHLEDARSGTSLRRLDIYTMPGGTGDMLQALQSQPGATRAGDGADLYVRGGEPEETPVFLNGGRMAFPGRWEGLNGSSMGILDPSVMSKAYFSAGGFSAKYGNALSGVVDVETQGRPPEARWRAGVNTVSAGGSLYRPLNARTGVWGTAMLTDVTLLAKMHGIEEQYPDMPRSHQIFAGGATQLTPAIEIRAVGLTAADQSTRIVQAAGYEGPFRSEGATQHGGVTARWLEPDGQVGVQASITASRRASEFGFGVLERRRTDNAFGARVDGDLITAGATRVRSGFELSQLNVTTAGRVPLTRNLDVGSPTRVLDNEQQGTFALGAYAEVQREILPALVSVIGVRADRLPGEDRVTLDPRLAVAYSTGDWVVRAATGIFHQGSWRRTYRLPDGGSPAAVPTRSRHVVIGAERAGEPSVRVETYRKLYDGYTTDQPGRTAIVSGTTTGLDVIARWQQRERLNGWITYSALDATLDLADGSRVSAKYDITHSLTGVARYALSDKWELGTTMRYATGRPYTPVTGAMAEQEGWPVEPVYGDVHSDRLPSYFRTDGRITRYHRIGGKTGVFYLEMLDLNGRKNVAGYEYDATYAVRTPVESFFARRTFVLGAELNF